MDCLIIGGGLAGWMAARECAAAGLTVCLMEDGQGASPWVHGFNAPVHPDDSPECFLQDTLQSGQGLSTPALARALCQDARPVFDSLRQMGLSFNREGDGYQLLRPLGASHPRVASIGNETGVEVLKALHRELEGRVQDMPGVRAVRLLTRDGRATGALAYNQKTGQWLTVQAKAVILACGGYCGIFPVSTNKRDSGGDGIGMAWNAGAKLCDMEFIQFEPSAAVWPEALIGTSVITTLLFEGAVLRNKDGERFMLRYGPEGERVGKDVMARRIAAEVAAGRGTPHGGVYFDATGVGRERLETGYAMYVERYRNVGIDLAAQWIELGPAPHTSLGGVCIDDQCRTTLPGLFACGEVVGGLHGANRIGGNAGLETLVFGRRAGISAAAYARSAAEPGEEAVEKMPYDSESCAPQLTLLRQRMRQALAAGVGAVRQEQSLAECTAVLQDCLEQVMTLHGADAQEAFQRYRLENDLIAALLTAKAALARRDTLGCHTRSDYPDAARPPYRLTFQKGEGGIEAKRESI